MKDAENRKTRKTSDRICMYGRADTGRPSARKIDSVIDFTKIYEIVSDLYCENNGRPSIDPIVLFKMVLIQHIYGIPSLRKTADEIKVNVAYRWFLGYLLNEQTPHFSTISYNFKNRFTAETIEKVFYWILNEIEQAGYLTPETVFVDGTHIKANANMKKAVTCTTEGSKSIHCSRCDATKDSTVIPVTDHTYGEWEVVTPSTCTENGVKKHACIHCGFEQTEIIEPAHEWEDSRTVDIAPSCTEQGEDSVHCRNCDERKDIKELSPKGHDWSEWKTLVEPTITSEGKACRACNVCGIKEEKALPKLSGKKEWKHDEKKHWHVDDNGNIIDLDDHEFKWVVDKEPTATEPGIGHYECIACAFEKAPEEFGKRNPETGASSLAARIAVAAVAGGAVPATYKARKRKNK